VEASLVAGVVDPTGDRAVYKQIADLLRAAIASGELAPGAQLPSEQELVDGHGVARGTVRQAIMLLRSEGLVDVERGRGSFVRDLGPEQERLVRQQWDKEHPHEPTLKIETLELGKTSGPAEVVELLGLGADADVLVRRWRYVASFMVLEMATSYVPWDIAEAAQLLQTETGRQVYTRLEDSGHRVARFTEEVQARMPTEAEARTLKIPPAVPVMSVQRVAYTDDGRPVEVRQSLMSAKRYRLMYEIRPE
jgi:GntR family transcriptional regulator